jgi:hypothetical protein
VDLVWSIAGWVLAAGGLLLAGWALFWDRARGRRRCPKCWYDMAGTSGLQCPECGRSARQEKSLSKTRRRPAGILVGTILMVGSYPIAHIPRMQAHGPIGAVPTTGLICWVSRYELPEKYNAATSTMSAPSRAAAELARRAMNEELWSWQCRWMLEAVGVIHARQCWPRGVPFEITCGIPSWLMGAAGQDLGVRSEPDGTKNPYIDHLLPWKIRTLEKDEDHVDLTVQYGRWHGLWRIPVRQVDTPEQAIVPVTGAQIDAAMRLALAAALRRDSNKNTSTGYMLGARLYRDKGPIPPDVAVGVTVEFRRDGQVMGQWPLVMNDSPYGEPVDWVRINPPSPGWDEEDASDLARWTVTVRGSAEVALRDLTRDRYWRGEWTVPVDQFMGRAAPKP